MSIKDKSEEKEKAIDNITYKTDKEKKQEKNNIKVASSDFTQSEMLQLKNLGYERESKDPMRIGKDKETGIRILKEILKLNK